VESQRAGGGQYRKQSFMAVPRVSVFKVKVYDFIAKNNPGKGGVVLWDS